MPNPGEQNFTWLNPTRVIFGNGRLDDLKTVVDSVAGSESRVFLVTGRHSLRARGVLQRIIGDVGLSRITLFDETPPFPSPEAVDDALTRCRESGSDVVVAVGGGSAMDLAKIVAILTPHEGPAMDYVDRKRSIRGRGLPFIAAPTTSGSSSEVTSGAAIWDMDGKRSLGLSSPLMFPTVAVVDPQLTMSMSKRLAAASGMDAFTSAFESYWSLESEPLSDAICLRVISDYAVNLERSCLQGDLDSRTACSLAATMSGIAYSNSHPNVCHAVGSPLTLYWGAEHGQAVGVTLSSFLRWNAPAIEHKLPALFAALGVEDLDAAAARIEQIMSRCGLKTRISALGVSPDDMDTLLDNIRWERVGVLPRPLEREDARALLEQLFV